MTDDGSALIYFGKFNRDSMRIEVHSTDSSSAMLILWSENGEEIVAAIKDDARIHITYYLSAHLSLALKFEVLLRMHLRLHSRTSLHRREEVACDF